MSIPEKGTQFTGSIGHLIFILAVGAAAIIIFILIVLFRKKKIAKNKALEGFVKHASTFEGLYEPLYLMASNAIKYKAGIIGDWAARTKNLNDAPEYREYWSKKLNDFDKWDNIQGIKKAKELISFVQNAGIKRDTSAGVVWRTNDKVIEKDVIGDKNV
ncbi:MAG: hypothetical protein FWD13_02845 [Treponema sp.]|nr:hypothetical protein [Treponema sp.]